MGVSNGSRDGTATKTRSATGVVRGRDRARESDEAGQTDEIDHGLLATQTGGDRETGTGEGAGRGGVGEDRTRSRNLHPGVAMLGTTAGQGETNTEKESGRDTTIESAGDTAIRD